MRCAKSQCEIRVIDVGSEIHVWITNRTKSEYAQASCNIVADSRKLKPFLMFQIDILIDFQCSDSSLKPMVSMPDLSWTSVFSKKSKNNGNEGRWIHCVSEHWPCVFIVQAVILKRFKKTVVQKHKKYEMQCFVSVAFLCNRKICENVRCAKTHSDIRDKYFLDEIHVWITNVAES